MSRGIFRDVQVLHGMSGDSTRFVTGLVVTPIRGWSRWMPAVWRVSHSIRQEMEVSHAGTHALSRGKCRKRHDHEHRKAGRV